ncbi:hypothetical protein CC1G_15418 [Coprinopsis cinerea okayama7|uniref:Uncharacterized protein n=1 Tax=Coprinopsis cinerea (strain Okayama-7 / 130 / ATCC MYA-4618 / FGSC 9003) TaxID=240176 RepID=D6RQT3_COPC7|nr:hypothetical protein CC1G_15418 [Coprinopsis cinerea okayama7\|eukprot:XP_002910141.1 hypothetical protein CC1G_15418 [Coprinopsis cinerea okayama7\
MAEFPRRVTPTGWIARTLVDVKAIVVKEAEKVSSLDLTTRLLRCQQDLATREREGHPKGRYGITLPHPDPDLGDGGHWSRNISDPWMTIPKNPPK